MREGWHAQFIRQGRGAMHYYRRGRSLCGKLELREGAEFLGLDAPAGIYWYPCAKCQARSSAPGFLWRRRGRL